MNCLINESMSDEAVYRTAPAAPGLLIIKPKITATYKSEDCA